MSGVNYRNKNSKILLLLVASVFSANTVPAKKTQTQPPNIIVIMTDDLGYGDTGCYGASKVKTPNIDRLATEGLRFTNAYAPGSTCTPTRYSLMTGEYAWRKKVGILPGDAAMTVNPQNLSLPGLMKRNGYTTACVGKWHLGLGNGNVDFNKKITPGLYDVGFDYSFIIPATNDRVPCVYIENDEVAGLDPNDPIQVSFKQKVGSWPTGREHPELLKLKYLHGHDHTIVNGISRIGYMTGGSDALWVDEEMAEVITGKAVDFIRKNASKPFFLYFATHNIHEPRVPGPKFKGSSQCGVYGDVIQEGDWSVGQILETLDELNLSDNTLIVFTSDNGPMVEEGYADGGTKNLNGHTPSGGLRGGKYTLFEGGTRLPFIVRWPKKVNAGISDAPLGYIDLFASFAALLNDQLAEKEAPDSRNALPALLGKKKKTSHNEVLIQDNPGNVALRCGNWKLIPKESHGKEQEDMLFDLKKDDAEQNNLANQFPEKVNELKKRIQEIKNGEGYR